MKIHIIVISTLILLSGIAIYSIQKNYRMFLMRQEYAKMIEKEMLPAAEKDAVEYLKLLEKWDRYYETLNMDIYMIEKLDIDVIEHQMDSIRVRQSKRDSILEDFSNKFENKFDEPIIPSDK